MQKRSLFLSLVLASSILYLDQPYCDDESKYAIEPESDEELIADPQEIALPNEEQSPPQFHECYPQDCFIDVQKVCSTLTLRHIDPGGFGYCHGYTSLEGLFFPFCSSCNPWPFIDLRVHYFNNNEWAGNVGSGIRHFDDCTNVAYGLNAYFDFRTDCHRDLFFPQAGLGFERLDECWDFRINGYFPFSRRKTLKHCHFDFPGGYFIDQTKYRVAKTGFDAELGRYFFHTDCFQFYGAIGPYFYGRNECSKSFLGVRGRLLLAATRYLTFEGIATYDRRFKDNYQGSIAINIPFGCCPRNGRKQEILSQRIYRNEIIVLDRFCKWDFNF